MGLGILRSVPFKVGDWLFIDHDAAVTVRDEDLSAVLGAATLLSEREGMLLKALQAGRRLDEIVGLEAYMRGDGPLALEV